MNGLRILAASNLSPESDLAIARAFLVARETGSTLRILHIADDSQPRPLIEQSLEFARRKLERNIAPLQEKHGIVPEIHLTSGDPKADIAADAREWNADLVVLGRHRPRSGEHRFEATVAASLIRSLRRPLLAVSRSDIRPYGTIVAGIDFSLPAKASIHWSRGLAPDAALHLVHAYQIPFSFGIPGDTMAAAFSEAEREETDAYLREEMAWLKRRADEDTAMRDDIHTHVIEGDTVDTISDMITKTNADLLALGAHGRTGIARMLLGSHSAAMLAAASSGKFDIDILVTPAR